MLDETAGVPIKEFIGLRSKMYSIKTADNKIKSTCKGVKKHIKEQFLTHEKYFHALMNESCEESVVYKINQKNHKLFTMKCKKTSLNPFNDKVKKSILN